MQKLYKVNIKRYNPSLRDISVKLSLFYGNTINFYHKLPMMYPFISLEEQKRADKFKNHNDRNNYVISHYLLNKQLSKTLHIPLNELQITFNKMRKPSISSKEIDFNLSHSKNYFCFGIINIPNAKVGVDIEKIEKLSDMKSIIDNYMHPEEKKYIYSNNLSNREELIRFYEVWTRKEAFLKMIGLGIVVELSLVNMTPNNIDVFIDNLNGINSTYKNVSIHTYTGDEFVISISSNLSDNPRFVEICEI